MKRIILIILFVQAVHVQGKNFTRCGLLKELESQGFPQQQLRDWVCLVEAESSRRTDVIGGPDDDGSFDYGLFQINDRYWCSSGLRRGKECNVRCEDVLTDNITMAAECTKKIYSRQGFEAWVGWVNECKNKELPDITDCSNTVAV